RPGDPRCLVHRGPGRRLARHRRAGDGARGRVRHGDLRRGGREDPHRPGRRELHRDAQVTSPLARTDPLVYDAIRRETERQEYNLELIASEYYGGCEFVDVVERAAIERAMRLFGAEGANVQPHSGSQANMCVYFSQLAPGDTILAMSLSHGGHLTHGSPVNFSGKFFRVVSYGVRESDGRIDLDQVRDLARRERPRLIVVGHSAYPRAIDF